MKFIITKKTMLAEYDRKGIHGKTSATRWAGDEDKQKILSSLCQGKTQTDCTIGKRVSWY